MKTLADVFASPPAEYRPAPQWSWNGALYRVPTLTHHRKR